jgi:hypothetical protein
VSYQSKTTPASQVSFQLKPIPASQVSFQSISTLASQAFLAHLVKGNVSFCHHLASVVCRPLTFHILIFSSETPQPKDAISEETIFKNQPIRNKNCLWQPCLLMNRDKINNI